VRRRKEDDQGRGSVATRRGRKKKRKEEDQGRREGGSAKARFRVSSTKKFLFLVHEYLGSERPISVEVLAPTRLCLRGSHVRRKFRKRTTLRSESSTLKGLLYAPIHSLCMGWGNLPTLRVGWRKYRNLFLFLINTFLLYPLS
jgi:hypothetical protein